MSEAEKISEGCIECGLCVDNCEFLSKYCESPKELADKYLENHFKDKPSIPYCCSLCDGCEVDCPEELNVGRMCLEARQTLVDEGVAPLTPHKIVKRDQDWDLSGTNVGFYVEAAYKHEDFPIYGRIRALMGDYEMTTFGIGFSF